LYATVERATGEVVGRCGLFHWDDVAGSAELEVGWLIARDRWGHGYATEAGRAWTRHAFETRGLARLIALILDGNTASVRVAEKLGMTREREVLFEDQLTRVFAMNR
jgi:RimJ/RimL family protein N-acetyltransferase